MTFNLRYPTQDRPIRRDREDKLDRGPFIKSLVRTLIRDERDDNGNLTGRQASGYVVGLTGKWGLGKSSILRLLEAELGSMDRVIVSYFNPWLFNGREELMRGFFSGLRDAMGRSTIEHARELSDALDRYWGAIDLAGHAVAAVADAKGAGGAATTFWARWGKRAKDALPKAEKLTPEKERQALEKKISERKLAVVVLIDELDRVEDGEVRAVAQLVKAVGDIEGLSYLVAYDPDRVTDALGRGSGDDRRVSGARYLEKIIQLPIPLRPLFDADVDALLEAELACRGMATPTGADENRTMILAQIKREIVTPRDIKRLVGAYAVLELATRGEIEKIDVLAYAWILTKSPALRDVLASNFDSVVIDPSEEEMIKRLEGRLDKEKEPHLPVDVLGQSAAMHSDLLKALFPRFRNDREEQDDGTRLYRRRNIVRLLYLGNPPGAVARIDVERVWNLTDVAAMQAALSDLRDTGRLTPFLDRIDDLLPQLPISGDTVFWPALSAVLTRKTDWITGPEPEHSLVSDAATSLVRLAMRDKREKPRVVTAVAALIQSGDLLIAPWILRKQMYAHGLSKHSRSDRGDAVYTKEETRELMRVETPRYKRAVLAGVALRRLTNMEAIYTIANQEAWDDELRVSLTDQLVGPEAISTAAALIVPPGYGADTASLDELFDVKAVAKEFARLGRFEKGMIPWLASSVNRFRALVEGRDYHHPDEID